MLYYPFNSIQLRLWENILNHDKSAHCIEKNTDLCDFLGTYDSNTLFHIFNGNKEILEVIFKKYQVRLNLDQLEDKEKVLPLLILSPNEEGQSALDLARENNKYRSFKIMIEFLNIM